MQASHLNLRCGHQHGAWRGAPMLHQRCQQPPPSAAAQAPPSTEDRVAGSRPASQAVKPLTASRMLEKVASLKRLLKTPQADAAAVVPPAAPVAPRAEATHSSSAVHHFGATAEEEQEEAAASAASVSQAAEGVVLFLQQAPPLVLRSHTAVNSAAQGSDAGGRRPMMRKVTAAAAGDAVESREALAARLALAAPPAPPRRAAVEVGPSTSGRAPETSRSSSSNGSSSSSRGARPQESATPRRAAKNAAAQHNFDLETGMAVAWLGTSSGAPTKERNVSCLLLRVPQAVYMVDCGEGTKRQLQQLDLDIALVDGIFITHLHGDHCFGAAAVLVQLDAAKQGLADPAMRRNRIVGPPGIAALLVAGLGLTGLVYDLALPLSVVELVVDAEDAHGPRPLMQDGSAPHVTVERMASAPIEEDPVLRASMAALNDERPELPSIWRPSRFAPPPGERSRVLESKESGNFVAEPGVFWDFPAGPHLPSGVHVRAAQLQHRVPCWGYTFTEPEATAEAAGSLGRKVVLLGDTVSSRCMAPLAYGADLISHEATFMKGMEDKARIAQHSTGWMAGMFARAMHTRVLVLTHFSSRYSDGAEGFSYQARTAEEEDEMAEAEQTNAIRCLIREAREEFPVGTIQAARDFYVHHVPLKVAAQAPAAVAEVERELVPASA